MRRGREEADGKGRRDLLEVLKAELEFLNTGGYARVPGSSWRPAYIFEDSPACMNHDYEVNPDLAPQSPVMLIIPVCDFRHSLFAYGRCIL